VYFALDRFTPAQMERFGRNLLRFIDILLREPQQRLSDLSVV
jgi:hypothetical protein